MTFSKIARGYGLWLLGVLSAAGALYFLHRSHAFSYELEADALEADGFVERVEEYLPDSAVVD